MAIGKNAKKRAARRAFHDTPCDGLPGYMPYSFRVVEYRDNVRRVLTFASLTSYKEYRKEFFSRNPTGQLSLVNPLSPDLDVNLKRGESFRSKVINKGTDTNKAKPKDIAQYKGNRLVDSVTGKRFRQEGFPTK